MTGTTAAATSCPGALDPADPGFAAAVAPFVTTLTPTPDAVVDARDAADVAAAVRWAAAHGRPVTVQATGHQLVADLSGSLLVSTRRLDDVRVNPVARTATVGGGARWHRVLAAAAEHGLAPVCGSSSQVGVAGFLLGGGHGPLSREFGVGSDHLRRVRLVTADGAVRDVDAERDPELFAALRGGKTGFGVVVELEVGLVPLTRLHGGGLFLPGAAAPEVLHAWREWTPTTPTSTSSSVALLRLPPDPSLPPPLRGAFVTHLRFCSTAPADEAAALLAPLRSLVAPLADTVGEIPVTAIDAVHADPTEPMPVWDDSATLGDLPSEAVDALLAVAGPGVDTPAMAELRQLGGAVAAGPVGPGGFDAVAGRDAAYGLYALAPMVAPVAAVAPAAARAVVDALRPWAVGSLPNFTGPGGGGRLGTPWSPPMHARLVAVRERVDPAGLFRTVGLR